MEKNLNTAPITDGTAIEEEEGVPGGNPYHQPLKLTGHMKYATQQFNIQPRWLQKFPI